jgi:hypothetical protein
MSIATRRARYLSFRISRDLQPSCSSKGPGDAMCFARIMSTNCRLPQEGLLKRAICQGIALLLASESLGCTSSTMIRASDPSASIFVDGDYRGKGSVSHRDTKTVGATTEVRIEKTGCAAKEFSFRRNEELDVGATIGGLFLLVPFLWVMKYKPSHSYTYACDTAKAHSGPRSKTQRSGATTETAASEFAKGKALWLEGKVSEACARFARSQQLEPDTGTLLLLADCHVQDGALSLARMELEEARERARSENRPDRVQYAEDRLQALASRQ